MSFLINSYIIGGYNFSDLNFVFLQNSNFNTNEPVLNISKIASVDNSHNITNTINDFATFGTSEPTYGAYTTFRRVSAVSTSNNFDYTFLISVYGNDWIMRRDNKTSTWVAIKRFLQNVTSTTAFYGTDTIYLKVGNDLLTWDQVTLPDSHFINNFL